jgi:hypothetical protein
MFAHADTIETVGTRLPPAFFHLGSTPQMNADPSALEAASHMPSGKKDRLLTPYG